MTVRLHVTAAHHDSPQAAHPGSDALFTGSRVAGGDVVGNRVVKTLVILRDVAGMRKKRGNSADAGRSSGRKCTENSGGGRGGVQGPVVNDNDD